MAKQLWWQAAGRQGRGEAEEGAELLEGGGGKGRHRTGSGVRPGVWPEEQAGSKAGNMGDRVLHWFEAQEDRKGFSPG